MDAPGGKTSTRQSCRRFPRKKCPSHKTGSSLIVFPLTDQAQELEEAKPEQKEKKKPECLQNREDKVHIIEHRKLRYFGPFGGENSLDVFKIRFGRYAYHFALISHL